MMRNVTIPLARVDGQTIGSYAQQFLFHINLWDILRRFIPGFRVREEAQLGLPPELTGYLTYEEELGLVDFLVEAGIILEVPETFGSAIIIGTAIIELMERYGILSSYSASRTAIRLRETVYLERFMEKDRDAAGERRQDYLLVSHFPSLYFQ